MPRTSAIGVLASGVEHATRAIAAKQVVVRRKDRENAMKSRKRIAQLFAALTAIAFCQGALALSLQPSGGMTPISIGTQSSGASGIAYFNALEYPAQDAPRNCQYNVWYIDTTVVTNTTGSQSTSNNFGRNAYVMLLIANVAGRKISRLDWSTLPTSPPSGQVVCWAYLIQLAD